MKRGAIHMIRSLIVPAVMMVALTACTGPVAERMADFELSDEPLAGKYVWHDLITDDPAAVRRFYGELFGWSFEATVHPNGGDYTLIRNGDGYLGGIVELPDPDGADYSRWLGYLSVADVDRAVALTREQGGRAVAGPLDLGEVGRAAAIEDPQGAVVGLLRSRYGDPLDTATSGRGDIVWNELLAADPAAAATFYGELAGLQQVEEQRPGGVYRTLRAQNRDRAGIMRRPSDEVRPVWLTHFAVADIGRAVVRAEQLGGVILVAPDPDVRDGLFAVITDPSGAVLALRQWTP
jgi:predicted enzyme related to lactoylglutathione lyase